MHNEAITSQISAPTQAATPKKLSPVIIGGVFVSSMILGAGLTYVGLQFLDSDDNGVVTGNIDTENTPDDSDEHADNGDSGDVPNTSGDNGDNQADSGRNSIENLVTDIRNYNFSMRMDLTVVEGGHQIRITSTTNGTSDEINQVQRFRQSTASSGLFFNIESFVDFGNGVTFSRGLENQPWVRTNGAQRAVSVIEQIEMMRGRGAIRVSDGLYRVRMTSEQLRAIFAAMDMDLGQQITGNLYSTVRIRNGFITRIEHDFSNMMPGVRHFTTVITFDNYNSAGSVTVPASARNVQ